MTFLNKVTKKYVIAVMDDEEEINDTPDESDAFLSPSGPLGSKTSLSVDGKHIGEFDSDEKAEDALVNWMLKNNYFPSVWYISDHGNEHPYTLSEKSKKKLGYK